MHHRTSHKEQEQKREYYHQDTDEDIVPFFLKTDKNHKDLLSITPTKI